MAIESEAKGLVIISEYPSRHRPDVAQVGVVILNWNGWPDTLECLDSILLSNHRSFDLILVDNGSSDQSLDKIRKWASKNYGEDDFRSYDSDYKDNMSDRDGTLKLERGRLYDGYCAEDNRCKISREGRFFLLQSSENLGFAGGCNLGIRHAMEVGNDYIWLLNNDTTVERNALERLVGFLATNPEVDGVTGQIRYSRDRSVIWNCGGRLTWYGTRRYYYANSPASTAPQDGWKSASFVTGCAILLRTALLREVGVLSDKFFFGEEDIEFCLRLKRHKRQLACVFNSIIYHKVSASTEGSGRKGEEGKIYIHLLNRFINMRTYYPLFVWHIWRIGVLSYIVPMMLSRYHLKLLDCWKMVSMLIRNSSSKTSVTREDFFSALGSFTPREHE